MGVVARLDVESLFHLDSITLHEIAFVAIIIVYILGCLQTIAAPWNTSPGSRIEKPSISMVSQMAFLHIYILVFSVFPKQCFNCSSHCFCEIIVRNKYLHVFHVQKAKPKTTQRPLGLNINRIKGCSRVHTARNLKLSLCFVNTCFKDTGY